MHAIRYDGRVYVDLAAVADRIREHVTLLQARDILGVDVEVEDVPTAPVVDVAPVCVEAPAEDAAEEPAEPAPVVVPVEPAPTPAKPPKRRR